MCILLSGQIAKLTTIRFTLVAPFLFMVIGIRQGKQTLGFDNPPTSSKRVPLIFLLCVTGYVTWSWVNALQINMTSDKIFPITVGAVTLIGCMALMIRMMLVPETDTAFADHERGNEERDAPHGLWSTLGWFAVLLVLSSLLGFILALGVFLVAFLRLRARLS